MACGEMKKCSAFLNYSSSTTENIIRKTVLKRNSKKENPLRKMPKRRLWREEKNKFVVAYQIILDI
jgi:hypothetical protein